MFQIVIMRRTHRTTVTINGDLATEAICQRQHPRVPKKTLSYRFTPERQMRESPCWAGSRTMKHNDSPPPNQVAVKRRGLHSTENRLNPRLAPDDLLPVNASREYVSPKSRAINQLEDRTKRDSGPLGR